jgi:DNA polymerase family B, exonuclease domain
VGDLHICKVRRQVHASSSISCCCTRDVPFSAAILEQGVPLDCLDGNAKSFQTYESNVLFALRFMVDTDIVGGNWVRRLCLLHVLLPSAQ